MGKKEKAEELFLQGYNCAQAVAGVFAEEMGMDFDTVVKTVSSFGGGMGRMREVCGTVTGMFFVAGRGYSFWRQGLKRKRGALSAESCLGWKEATKALYHKCGRRSITKKGRVRRWQGLRLGLWRNTWPKCGRMRFRACPQNHFSHLYPPLSVIFVPSD